MKIQKLFLVLLVGVSSLYVKAEDYFPDVIYGEATLDSVVYRSNELRSTFVYANDGRILTETSFVWNEFDHVWSPYRVEYIYDTLNTLVYIIDYGVNSISHLEDIDSLLYVHTYDGDLLVSDSIFNRVSSSSEWEYNWKQEYDADGHIVSIIASDGKKQYSYDSNGRVIEEEIFLWNSETSTWDNYYWEVYSYNSHGDRSYKYEYYWNKETNAWKGYRYKYEYHYYYEDNRCFTAWMIYYHEDEGTNNLWLEEYERNYTYDKKGNIVEEQELDDKGNLLHTVLWFYSYSEPQDEHIDLTTQGIEMHKIIHNGQILILRGEKVYTLQGQEVK